MKIRYIAFLLPLFFFSCVKKHQPVAWLKIGNWVLESNPDATYPEGELSEDISQVFVTLDGKSLGAYQVPVKIPIIAKSGEHKLILMAGVRDNGINETKVRYPFFQHFTKTINLVENDTISVTPTTSYYDNTKFLIEDFESPSLHLESSSGSTATLTRENDPSILKWGNYYGAVHLTEQDSLLSFVTTFAQSLPKYSTPVYLELDYMNTNSLLTSLISYGNETYYTDPYILINPQDASTPVWKHMYINLTEDVSYRVTSPNNEVEFKLLLDDDLTSSYFYIDNIKIVYPE